MADAHPKLSRRALLGAVFAAPVLSRHSGLDPESTFFADGEKDRWMPDQVRHDKLWTRALAHFRRAEATLARLEGGPDEDAFGRAHEAFNAALGRLVAVPAPDLEALAAKIEIAVAEEIAELSFGPLSLAQLARDARRLAAGAA